MKKIALISPASPGAALDQQAVTCFLNDLGYEPVYGAHAFDVNRFVAGTDADRLADLHWAFTDPEIDAIMTIRGGYGTPRLLDKIDYKLIKKNQKPFVGFSDVTALQLALWHKCHFVSFTGFQANFIGKPMARALVETLRACLNRDPITYEGLTLLTKGVARGHLVGGSLTLLTGLIGTPYMPKLKDAILVLEEVQEQPYRIDRMIEQLHLSGALDHVAGVVLGGFYNCISKDKTDGTIDEVLQERFAGLNIPVVRDFRYGHGDGEIVFPIGAKATLDANKGVLELNGY